MSTIFGEPHFDLGLLGVVVEHDTRCSGGEARHSGGIDGQAHVDSFRWGQPAASLAAEVVPRNPSPFTQAFTQAFTQRVWWSNPRQIAHGDSRCTQHPVLAFTNPARSTDHHGNPAQLLASSHRHGRAEISSGLRHHLPRPGVSVEDRGGGCPCPTPDRDRDRTGSRRGVQGLRRYWPVPIADESVEVCYRTAVAACGAPAVRNSRRSGPMCADSLYFFKTMVETSSASSTSHFRDPYAPSAARQRGVSRSPPRLRCARNNDNTSDRFAGLACAKPFRP